jgi:hypothetical protein
VNDIGKPAKVHVHLVLSSTLVCGDTAGAEAPAAAAAAAGGG